MANGLSQHRVADSLSGDSGTRNSAAEVGNTANSWACQTSAEIASLFKNYLSGSGCNFVNNLF